MKSVSTNPKPSPAMAFAFDMLPAKIHLEIYRWAVGNRTIHVRDALLSVPNQTKSNGLSCPYRLRYYVCKSRLSEAEIYESYNKPVVFKNRIDWHMRPRLETMSNLHFGCICTEQRASLHIDLNILAASREAHDEAVKAFYSTNKWSFRDTSALEKWLAAIPDEFLLLVQHVHLELRMTRYVTDVRSGLAEWRVMLSHAIHTKLPNLRSLNLTITLGGFATCWRESQGEAFTNVFRPLRQLKQLREFTVVMNPSTDSCEQGLHDENTHTPFDNCAEYDKKETFWERKELRRVWAEEIRDFVLKRE